jgi:hypothetical protein
LCSDPPAAIHNAAGNFFAEDGMLSQLRLLMGAALLAAIGSSSAHAQMWVNVDGYLINDNLAGDLDSTVGRIVFDSLSASPNGFTTNSGFDAKGVVETSNVAGALAGQLNSGQSLVLTQFVADMPAAASPGVFNIQYENTFGPAIPGGGTAADILVAFANDGTGWPPYATGAGAIPLLTGEDVIVNWQGYVDNVPIPNPTTPFPPLFNVAGLNTAYQTFGHATTSPLFGGVVFNPILRGDLTFYLGGPRNQFVLLTSAEVGLEDLGDPAPTVPVLPAAGLAVLTMALVATASFQLRRARPLRADE